LSTTYHPLTSFLLHAPSTSYLSPLSLHDALPISRFVVRGDFNIGTPASFAASSKICGISIQFVITNPGVISVQRRLARILLLDRSEEHTSELQSRFDLVCRLLLEKKKT